jgi:hypothetical protein
MPNGAIDAQFIVGHLCDEGHLCQNRSQRGAAHRGRFCSCTMASGCPSPHKRPVLCTIRPRYGSMPRGEVGAHCYSFIIKVKSTGTYEIGALSGSASR